MFESLKVPLHPGIYNTEHRIWAVYAYTLLVMLGLAPMGHSGTTNMSMLRGILVEHKYRHRKDGDRSFGPVGLEGSVF